MELLAIICIIWLFILQGKVNNINEKLENISNNLNKDNIKTFNEPNIDVPFQEANEFPINEIQDDNFQIEKTEINDTNNFENDIPQTNKTVSSFESMFMGNIFNKIGAVAILIGIGILVKLISSYIEFTDIMKISAGYLAGLGMIFASFKIQNKINMKNFAEVLMGTGFGALLITTYCATSLMNIFNIEIATVIASIITVAIYFLADKQKTTSMLVIGLIGGYLNPFFINDNISADYLFWYLIFLNLISLIFVYRNPFKQKVNIFNLILTSITILCFSYQNKYSLLQCLILWIMYIIYDILIKDELSTQNAKIQTYLNFGVLTVLSWVLFENHYQQIGILLLSTSIIYGILGKININKFPLKDNSYFYSSIISLFLCTYFLTDELLRITLWSIEGILVTFVLLKYDYKNLAKCSLGFLAASICNVFFVNNIYNLNTYPLTSLNFVPPIISGFLISNLFKKYNDENFADICKFITISAGYSFLIIILNSLIGDNYSKIYIKIISYAVICFIYSANILLYTFKDTPQKIYKIIGHIVYFIGLILLLGSETYMLPSTIPVLNLRLVGYLIAISDLYLIIRRNNNEFLKYLMVALGFAYIHYESVNTVKIYEFLNINWLITFMWTIYAGIISLIGIFKDKKFLKISGIWISIFLIIRLFIFDFAGLDMIFKLLAFLTLGIVLMLISYFYNKNKN